MTRYEVKDSTGKVHVIDATDPESAAQRIADLKLVTVVATRESRQPTIRIGIN